MKKNKKYIRKRQALAHTGLSGLVFINHSFTKFAIASWSALLSCLKKERRNEVSKERCWNFLRIF